MTMSRRQTLQLTGQLAGLAGFAALAPLQARAQTTGNVSILPVEHASLMLDIGGKTIAVDPVGEKPAYTAKGAPAFVLITHEHGDHYDPKALAAINAPRLIVNPAVMAMLPDDLKAKATQIANGEKIDVDGVTIEAVPAYNTTEERKQFHPKGRDNGYIVSAGGPRIYIAGDTEDTPEMRALTDIDIALLPMNLPFTMTVEQAADAVKAFKPKTVYPYHYRGKEGLSDVGAFAKLVGDASKVVQENWYP